MVYSTNYEPLDIVVTNVNGRQHARLYRAYECTGDREVIDEMACESRLDVGKICGIMLRWYCKMGLSPESKMARAARKRNSHSVPSHGKIWYKKDIIKDVYKLHKNKI